MFNAHEVIGWFNCANLLCRNVLTSDHVTVITTAQMRRFCGVECITEGQTAWNDFLHFSYNRFGEQLSAGADALMREELPRYITALTDAQEHNR